MKINHSIDKNEIKKKLRIEPNGRVQKILDNQLVYYLRENEPIDTKQLQNNTRVERPGLVVVATPYAHYQNEGIVYVDPETKKGAFYDSKTGRYWSRPDVKKVKSNRKFSTYGAARGPRFVKRTLTERKKDILRDIKEGMKQ